MFPYVTICICVGFLLKSALPLPYEQFQASPLLMYKFPSLNEKLDSCAIAFVFNLSQSYIG